MDDKSLGQSYFDDFWDDRYKDCRTWGGFMCLFATVWQIWELFAPISEKHFWINIGYTVNSAICFAIYGYSFKKHANLKIILIPSILITTRFEIRMLDFEETTKLIPTLMGK